MTIKELKDFIYEQYYRHIETPEEKRFFIACN